MPLRVGRILHLFMFTLSKWKQSHAYVKVSGRYN
jgi:hypothetical protein